MVKLREDGSVYFGCPSDDFMFVTYGILFRKRVLTPIFSADTALEVRQHNLSDECANHILYRQLKSEHNQVDRSRPTETPFKERLTTRTHGVGLGQHADVPWRSRLARMTPEMLVDYVQVVSTELWFLQRTAN